MLLRFHFYFQLCVCGEQDETSCACGYCAPRGQKRALMRMCTGRDEKTVNMKRNGQCEGEGVPSLWSQGSNEF